MNRKELQRDTYSYGKGEVYLAEIVNGVLQPWVWLFDVSKLSISSDKEEIKHQESYSGQNATVRKFTTSVSLSLAMTLMTRNGHNLQIALSGNASITDATTVTAETLAEVENGDTVFLENMGASALVLSDKTGAVISQDYYEFHGDYGKIKFTNLPSPMPEQPFSASYKHEKRLTNTIMTDFQKNYALKYVGVNLAENGAPCRLGFHKISADMAKEFSLISDGNELDGMEIEGAVLMDTTKPKDGKYGQFGYYEQLV